MAVFTNFAATLARQPSAALLAPRLKNRYFHEIYAKKYESEFPYITTKICNMICTQI